MTSQLSKKHSFDTVFDSQKVFRLILEAMSNPARVVGTKEFADKLFGEYPAFLAVAMTLLDNESCFNVCGNQLLSDEIASLTLAKRTPMESADFVFVCTANDMEPVIQKAKCGTLSDPHKSATVVIQNDGQPVCQMALAGPGINGCTVVRMTQVVKDALAFRDMQNYEYPQGIDLLFISDDGGLFSIPRLIQMEVQ
ncbi:MAG: phosphonate C-P lyase system protein PhnH [Dehalococcoidia bacterium]|nr:phosphonate C-P lyase system protein PhnH [Dehalococcoidia bacterium]